MRLLMLFSFNSKLVRLKGQLLMHHLNCELLFQFQTGSIKSERGVPILSREV